jgi:hypothetical protein
MHPLKMHSITPSCYGDSAIICIKISGYVYVSWCKNRMSTAILQILLCFIVIGTLL